MVPFFLGLNAISFVFWPSFMMMCVAFGSVKAMDYSIFGIIKEMLYIPLKVDEKFKAKAIIDVFAYRSSKALASLFILILQYFALSHLNIVMSWGLVVIFTTWMAAVIFMFKYYYKEVDRQHLNWPELKNTETSMTTSIN